MFTPKNKGLVNECPRALFKHSKISNYSSKKTNILISNALITCIFINTYYLWSLKSAPGALVNISNCINRKNVQVHWDTKKKRAKDVLKMIETLSEIKQQIIQQQPTAINKTPLAPN